jgi:hypothetical protein
MSEKRRIRAQEPEQFFDETIAEPQGHCSIETLSAYHRRLLSPQETELVRDHVVLCRACQLLLLDLARFLDDEQRPGRITPEEVEEARRRLEARTSAKAR